VQMRSQGLKRVLFGAIMAALLLSVANCKQGSMAGADSGSGEVAARVGNVDIPLSRVDRLIEQGLKGQSDKKLSDLNPVELAAARLQALDTLVTEEVLFQRARQEQIQISDEDVRSHIQGLIQSDGMSQDDFDKRLKQFGLSKDEFNEEQRRRLAVNKLQEKISIVKPPTDREISDYFSRNQNQFKLGRGVYLSAIIVDAANNQAKNDAIGEDQAKQKIESVANQLKTGADFATVARIQSEDMSAIKGGDLGFLDEQSLMQMGFPPQLVAIFFNMREGDITPVMQAGAGRWVIFKLTAKRTQEEKLTLDNAQVKAQISQALIGQRKEILNSALLTTALNQVRVENYLAKRMLQNPDNFGSLRPTSLPGADASGSTKPAESAKPTESAKPVEGVAKEAEKEAAKEAPKEAAKDAKSPEAGK
jgi:peptidyl-prolyl cis-trans isomerase SurA